MFAFVARHHGDKIPKCKEANSTTANSTADAHADELAVNVYKLPTDLGTGGLANVSLEFDDPTHGFNDYHGRLIRLIFKNDQYPNKVIYHYVFNLFSQKTIILPSLSKKHRNP